jgi:ubiquinone/menaquinone biosynthesis C-methylase UbiE
LEVAVNIASLFHPSSRPAGHGITIGTPRFYELSAAVLFRGRGRSYRTLLIAAGVRPGDRVLDVGCGPGHFARMLARAAGPHGAVVGIDAAPEMVEYAGRRARRMANLRFQAGAAESLPFDDGSFDVVVSSLMMHHLPDELRPRAAHEMRRVLRSGGTLLVADYQPAPGRLSRIHAALGAGRAMERRVSPLEPLVAEAGFTEPRSGDAPPWLHYVRAMRP